MNLFRGRRLNRGGWQFFPGENLEKPSELPQIREKRPTKEGGERRKS